MTSSNRVSEQLLLEHAHWKKQWSIFQYYFAIYWVISFVFYKLNTMYSMLKIESLLSLAGVIIYQCKPLRFLVQTYIPYI